MRFRPVVFVRVLTDGSEGRLSRVYGRIGRADDDSDGDSDSDSDRDGDDGRFTLEAVVIELGEAGTFAHLKGMARSGVDDGRQFSLMLAPGQGFGDASLVTAQLQDGSKIYSRSGIRLEDAAIMDGVRGVFDGVLMLANDAPDLLKTALAVLDIDAEGQEVLRGEIMTAGEDRRLMLATDVGDRCVDMPLDADIFLVTLVESRLGSERGTYADPVPGLNIDVYGAAGTDGCFVADTIIADATDVAPPPAENRPPVADAGDDQSVETGTGVMLDGTGSSDPDADPLSYAWTLAAPAGSSAMLDAADTAMPSFTAVVDGDYVGTLVVNDGQLDSDPDSVTVTASTPVVLDGFALYAANCELCHGPIASSSVENPDGGRHPGGDRTGPGRHGLAQLPDTGRDSGDFGGVAQ